MLVKEEPAQLVARLQFFITGGFEKRRLCDFGVSNKKAKNFIESRRLLKATDRLNGSILQDKEV